MSNDQWNNQQSDPNANQWQGQWGYQPGSQPSASQPGAESQPSAGQTWDANSQQSAGQASWDANSQSQPSAGQTWDTNSQTSANPNSWDQTSAQGGWDAAQQPAAGQTQGWENSNYQWNQSQTTGWEQTQSVPDQSQAAPGQAQYSAGQYDAGYAPAQQQPYAQPVQTSSNSGVGFFKALFDFGFHHFVTPSIIKIVYAISVVMIALSWLIMAFVVMADNKVGGIFLLLLGWIPALLSIALTRVQLEYMVALIRTSEYARDIKKKVVDGE